VRQADKACLARFLKFSLFDLLNIIQHALRIKQKNQTAVTFKWDFIQIVLKVVIK